MPPAGAARPAWPRFADVIGQREAIWRIQAAATAGRLHHALLLDGPAGCGKTSIAIALAAALFCRNRPVSLAPPSPVRAGGLDPITWPLEACRSCASCRKMPAHPDLSLLEVQSDKTRISIEQAREATAGIGFRPHEAAWRAIVVREADRLSEPAANALLKSIEEPREGNIFVLTTARPAYVQPTIRSRCFRVPLRALDPATVRRLLAERRPDVPPEALDLAAGLSAGGVARGLELLDADAAGVIRAAASFGTAVAEGDAAGVLAAAEALAGDQAGPGLVLDLLLTLARDRIAGSVGLPPLLGPGAASASEAFGRHPVEAAAFEADLVSRARRLVERNARAQMLFEWTGMAAARAVARAGKGLTVDG